jgi:hypothetical protein
MKEDKIQADIVKYYQSRVKGPLRWGLIRLKNENSTGRDIAMGVVPGAADLMLTRGEGQFCWIEVKTEGGTQSDKQKVFESNHNQLNNDYFIVRSVDDFAKVMEWFFYGKTIRPKRDRKDKGDNGWSQK